MLKTTDSLDQIGIFSRNPHDLKLLFSTMHVKGNNYPMSNKFLKNSNHVLKNVVISARGVYGLLGHPLNSRMWGWVIDLSNETRYWKILNLFSYEGKETITVTLNMT